MLERPWSHLRELLQEGHIRIAQLDQTDVGHVAENTFYHEGQDVGEHQEDKIHPVEEELNPIATRNPPFVPPLDDHRGGDIDEEDRKGSTDDLPA